MSQDLNHPRLTCDTIGTRFPWMQETREK